MSDVDKFYLFSSSSFGRALTLDKGVSLNNLSLTSSNSSFLNLLISNDLGNLTISEIEQLVKLVNEHYDLLLPSFIEIILVILTDQSGNVIGIKVTIKNKSGSTYYIENGSGSSRELLSGAVQVFELTIKQFVEIYGENHTSSDISTDISDVSDLSNTDISDVSDLSNVDNKSDIVSSRFSVLNYSLESKKNHCNSYVKLNLSNSLQSGLSCNELFISNCDLSNNYNYELSIFNNVNEL
jgi:hypothetical protein